MHGASGPSQPQEGVNFLKAQALTVDRQKCFLCSCFFSFNFSGWFPARAVSYSCIYISMTMKPSSQRQDEIREPTKIEFTGCMCAYVFCCLQFFCSCSLHSIIHHFSVTADTGSGRVGSGWPGPTREILRVTWYTNQGP